MHRGNGDAMETESEFQLNCRYKLFDGQPCHGRFSVDELADVRMQFLGMTHDELEIAIFAKLSCGMHLSTFTTASCRGQQKVRKSQRTDFYGFRACHEIFRYIHGIGQDKLTALIAHYKTAGVKARIHLNKRKRSLMILVPSLTSSLTMQKPMPLSFLDALQDTGRQTSSCCPPNA